MKKEFKPTHEITGSNGIFQAINLKGKKVEWKYPSATKSCGYYFMEDGTRLFLHDSEVKPL